MDPGGPAEDEIHFQKRMFGVLDILQSCTLCDRVFYCQHKDLAGILRLPLPLFPLQHLADLLLMAQYHFYPVPFLRPSVSPSRPLELQSNRL